MNNPSRGHGSRFLTVAALASCALVPASLQANWPQFRGPDGQGRVADGVSLPAEWSPEKNVAWKAEIPGKGWSSPVVVADRIYLTTAVAPGEDQNAVDVDRSLRAVCLDAKSGEILWNVEVFQQKAEKAPKIHSKNSHASPTPVCAHEHLFVHFGHMGTACLTPQGETVWKQTDLTYEPVHGNGGSPAVAGDKLVFSCDGPPDPFVAALNLRDGTVAWKTRRDSDVERKFSFSTPLVVEGENGQQQVVIPGSGKVAAYDPQTGDEIWSVDYGDGYSVVPRPVAGHGNVYLSSGFGRAVLYAIQHDGRGDVTSSHVKWTVDKAVPKNSSFLLDGADLYMFDDKGIGSCVDALSGEILWQERVSGPVSASPILADGRIYLPDELGVYHVIKASRQYEKLAENDMGEATLASPAVDGNALILRTETALYRVEK